MADEDNWDEFEIPEGAFAVNSTGQSPTESLDQRSPTPKLASTAQFDKGKQPLDKFAESDEQEDWEKDWDDGPAGDLSPTVALQAGPSAPTHAPSTSAAAGIHFISAASLTQFTATQTEDSQDSTVSSTGGTIKSLLSNFAGLSLASPDATASLPHCSSSTDSVNTLDAFDAPDDSNTATPRPQASRRSSGSTEHGSPTALKTATVRKGSALSQLVASATSGPGRVVHLGSTPPGKAKAADDWDADLDLDGGLPLDSLRTLRPKGSFSSHISDADDDAPAAPASPSYRKNPPLPIMVHSPVSPQAERGHKSSTELEAMTDKEDFDESDFELPTLTNDELGAAPALKLRSSLASLSERRGSVPSIGGSAPPSRILHPQQSTPPSASRLATSSPALSFGDDTSETDVDLDDDAAFFTDLVLPPFFLGGPGAMTPPSDGEGGSGKVDLQAVLRRKLAERAKQTETPMGSPTLGKGGKLDSYVDHDHDEVDGGLVIGDVKLNEERVRTSSRPQRPLLKQRAGTAPTTIRRSLPGAGPSRSNTTGPNLTRSGSSGSQSSATGKQPLRPASATGVVERGAVRERPVRTGPPPAPSTALRDRVRTRTTSLRPSSSAANLKAGTTRQVPPTINTDQGAALLSPLASPLPATPASAVSSVGSLATPASVRRRTSSQQLLTPRVSGPGGGAATAARTISRQRSLQNLATPSSAKPSAPVGRRQAPSPTPGPRAGGRTTPISNLGHFAQPTAASASRVRERVNSGPPAVIGVDRDRYGNIGLGIAGSNPTAAPRPTSALGGRLTRPTLASQAKAKDKTPSVPNTPVLSGLRVPSAPLKLAKPRRARPYGDGTELDGFDDLPTNREREAKVVKTGLNQAGLPAKPKATKPSTLVRKTSSSSGIGRMREKEKEAATAARVGAKERATTSLRSGTLRPATSSSSLNPNARPAQKRPSATPGSSPEKPAQPQKKRAAAGARQPQLIQNLGRVPAKHGEMTWNAKEKRWEGNEHVLRAFDSAVQSSARPALITNIPLGSPGSKALAFPTIAGATAAQQANVRVVGGMVFDPVQMSWHAIDGEDDELDLPGDEVGEMADDEGGEAGMDGWARGEEARMLKTRASFVASEASGGGEDWVRRAWREVWEESVEAERRHGREVAKWAVVVGEGEEVERGWLWGLSKLVRREEGA